MKESRCEETFLTDFCITLEEFKGSCSRSDWSYEKKRIELVTEKFLGG